MKHERIRTALQHANVLGAGAKKRRELSPEERKEAVFKEGYRGTLHSGSGEIVHDPKQMAAIAYSEAGESKEDKKKKIAEAVRRKMKK